MNVDAKNRKLIFISGLHRSGTSALHRIIASANQVVGFKNTPAHAQEGQHLQSVYKVAGEYGGAGKFAFHPEAKLTENSKLIKPENREKLIQEWGRYLNFDSEWWVEKSPPNLIRTRFLQSMFPRSIFITILRHPIAVSLATEKWAKNTIEDKIRHWLKAHEIYFEDKKHLKQSLDIQYLEFANSAAETVEKIEDFANINIPYRQQFENRNQKYFDQWNERVSNGTISKEQYQNIINSYEIAINEYGFSFINNFYTS